MTIDPSHFQQLLTDFKLGQLFINELGWDHANLTPQNILVDDEHYTITTIAQKRGVAVLVCSPDSKENIPTRPTLLKIEKEATKLAHEHLLIFTNVDNSTLTWLWVLRTPGQPSATRTHTWHKGTSGEALRQKLSQIVWSLEDEEAITLTDVITGLKCAFDQDKISKKFFTQFKVEHEVFNGFIEGISAVTDRAWYASLMLNRLMFVYFIQRKGFLDANHNYLSDRMLKVREKTGEGHFLSFYRLFLRRLFHEGLGQSRDERDSDFSELIGEVPYLNGGLFDVHELESSYPEIDIPDAAFERLFAFFDAYDWHLDDRPLSKGNEINPDVLGYIFEKYINQKQMGAYYTKEDITDYIGKNTVIPHLLEQARDRCKVAFEGDTSVWTLLKADPDRYIYPVMKTGVIHASGNLVPVSVLPDFVQKGLTDPKSRMFERRYSLGEAVFHVTTINGQTQRGTLPAETWREYVERRKRCLAMRDKLASGAIKSTGDLITLNLDIRQFMQDVIDGCTSPDLLRAIWQAIVGRVPERTNESFRHGITILDPTCGSGAFLFASLNVLEPLYEACLDRMEGFVEDAIRLGKPGEADFVKVLEEVGHHHSRSYFIYKSIILHNLFGVDIMAEAVEICKLRLFLKLVSQVDAGGELEPLPDIDFNIRAGNTLVGYATYDELQRAVVCGLDFDNAMEKIAVKAADLQHTFDKFRQLQTEGDGSESTTYKLELQQRLKVLEDELNRYLAGEYGVEVSDELAYTKWLKSHQPFHWFIQFYGILKSGGFDVIVGNPPYVEKRTVESQYRLTGYETETTNNLYAYCSERAFELLTQRGRFGFIVPLSSMSTDKFKPLQNLALGQETLWLSNFDDRPSRLFDGLEHIQLTIILAIKTGGSPSLPFTTACRKWASVERPHLFATLRYSQLHRSYLSGSVAKAGGDVEVDILDKLWSKNTTLVNWTRKVGKYRIFYTRKVHSFLNVLDFVPKIYDGNGKRRDPSEQKTLEFDSKPLADAALCALNSTLFRWFLSTFSDCRNLNRREVLSIPIDLSELVEQDGAHVAKLARELSASLQRTSETREMRFKGVALKVQCIIPRHSKPILDEIDTVLAGHYGLTAEELDFILNYDIKYRLGRSNGKT